MPKFKTRDHYYIPIGKDQVEVTEEVYRIWLRYENWDIRHQRYYWNRHKKVKGQEVEGQKVEGQEAKEKEVLYPAWLVYTEEFSGAYKISGPKKLEPEQGMNMLFLKQELWEAISTLSIKQQKVIYLLYFKDLTQEDAAEILGMSQPLLYHYKKTALLALRKYFDKKGLSFLDFIWQE